MSDSAIIEIRQALNEDSTQIIDLLNDVFLPQQRTAGKRTSSYFDWKFLSSPFGKSILTVATVEDEIIGIDHLWPWELHFNNDLFRAYEATDAVVKKEFRGKRILEQMRSYGIKQAANEKADFLFNFPNHQSLKTNINYGYKYLGKIKWWVKPLRPVQIMKSLIGISSNDSNKPEAFTMNYAPLNLSLLEHLHNNFLPKKLITINRTQGYFQYRYIDKHNSRYGQLTYKQEIAAIFTININDGVKEMVILEILGDKSFIKELLKIITNKAKEFGCAFVAVINDNLLLNKGLLLEGFLPKKEKNMVVYPLKEQLKLEIDKFSSWNLTASLHDSI
ncbi:MAG: GNAT family N-acetyltransferase [Bacteroidales bacterium]